MEACFDELLSSLRENEQCIRSERLSELCAYYESGQWLKDYELDEKGLLPPSLKRGVLSQDAVYDLLAEIKPLREKQ